MHDSLHQNQLPPAENKFHVGNRGDGKHYWLTPPEVMEPLQAEFQFDFDPCPYPRPDDFDGLTCEWGQSNYVNAPFGSIMHNGKKKGPTAWVRKAIEEQKKGKRVVLVFPVDKWILMLVKAGAEIRNLGDVKWLATEDGTACASRISNWSSVISSETGTVGLGSAGIWSRCLKKVKGCATGHTKAAPTIYFGGRSR